MNADIGLLVLRVGVGLMMALGHGWDKLINFTDRMQMFPNPIGLGSTASLVLVVVAEFFAALAVALGIGTRVAAGIVTINMLVAGLIYHSADPWGRKELALLYAVAFLALFFTGGGRYSLDLRIRFGKNR